MGGAFVPAGCASPCPGSTMGKLCLVVVMVQGAPLELASFDHVIFLCSSKYWHTVPVFANPTATSTIVSAGFERL